LPSQARRERDALVPRRVCYLRCERLHQGEIRLESLIIILVAAIAVYIVFKIVVGILRFIISLAIIGVAVFLLVQFLS
jgi:hypothetical protein